MSGRFDDLFDGDIKKEDSADVHILTDEDREAKLIGRKFRKARDKKGVLPGKE
jgi:hypothetical protein